MKSIPPNYSVMSEAKNENNPQFWDSMYKADESAWDLGGPTPFFKDLAKRIFKR